MGVAGIEGSAGIAGTRMMMVRSGTTHAESSSLFITCNLAHRGS